MWFSTLLLKNLLRRKFRSALTCIGFAVAVGTTVALMGVSDSFERTWLESMTGRGLDIIITQSNKPDPSHSILDQSFGKKISAVKGIKGVAPSLVEGIGWSDDEHELNTLILQGWEAESLLFNDVEVLTGRLFKPGEENVIVIGTKLANTINKGVGDTMSLLEVEFKIVGIYKSFVHYENGAVVVPLEELQKLLGRDGDASAFAIVLEDKVETDPAELKRVLNDLKALELTNQYGDTIKIDPKEAKDFVTGSFQIKLAHAMAWVTSAIAIIVGSIGVLNTMIMSVVERVREIAILRAIGWKKSRVIRMILGEALILSLIGAAIGIASAIVLVQWLTTLPSAAGFIEGSIDNSVIWKGFALAIVVGFLGGSYPAWHAAKLLPSEGLRHE